MKAKIQALKALHPEDLLGYSNKLTEGEVAVLSELEELTANIALEVTQSIIKLTGGSSRSQR